MTGRFYVLKSLKDMDEWSAGGMVGGRGGLSKCRWYANWYLFATAFVYWETNRRKRSWRPTSGHHEQADYTIKEREEDHRFTNEETLCLHLFPFLPRSKGWKPGKLGLCQRHVRNCQTSDREPSKTVVLYSHLRVTSISLSCPNMS